MRSPLMRLSSLQQQQIRDTVRDCFGPGARVLLFGSRLDEERRGGDIDLLVQSDLPAADSCRARIRCLARLDRALEGRPVDLVLTTPDDRDNRSIVRHALATGVEL